MPIAGKRYVYGHPPKNAGTTITHALRRFDDGKQSKGGHDPIDASTLDGRQPIISLADPWTWYARLWAHAMSAGQRCRQRAFAYGKTFREFVLSATSPAHVDGVIFERLEASHGGLYSQVARHIAGDTEPIVIDGTRPIEGLLLLAIDAVNHEAHKNKRAARGHYPGIPDGEYPEWYDAEMLRAVARGDGELAKRFGALPFCGLSAPIVPWKGEPMDIKSKIAELEAERAKGVKLVEALVQKHAESMTMLHRLDGALTALRELDSEDSAATDGDDAPSSSPREMFSPDYSPAVRPPGVGDDDPRVLAGVYE